MPSFTGAGCGGATITAPFGATQLVLPAPPSTPPRSARWRCAWSARSRAISSTTFHRAGHQCTRGHQSIAGNRHARGDGCVEFDRQQNRRRDHSDPGHQHDLYDRRGNAGPDDVTGLGINDTPPASLTFTSWTCVASAGSIVSGERQWPHRHECNDFERRFGDVHGECSDRVERHRQRHQHREPRGPRLAWSIPIRSPPQATPIR